MPARLPNLYFRKCMTVDFVVGGDYGNLAMFVDELPIHW